ncbi:MAG: efflux RND transporter periplasmic adaptor subunit [Pseudomonadota bacterium]|nr:efflux RND transporter periplasmic adaptor subunit [Pseudomonadota bacterium]
MQAPEYKQRRTRRAINALGFVVVICAGIAGAAILIATKPELKPATPEERVWPVNVVMAERADHQPDMVVYGEIVAGRTAEMRALVAGTVVEVAGALRNGAPVHAGDLLIRIDPFEYEAAVTELKAQIAEARARVAEAEASRQSEAVSLGQDRQMQAVRERDLERTQSLHKRGNISDKALDQAKLELTLQQQTVARRDAAVKTAEARLAQQRATVDRLLVELQRAERNLEHTRLVAPFDGFLADVNAQIGQRLSVNDRVARLIGAGELEARGHLSDTQYGRLVADGGLEGRPAKVAWRVGDRFMAYDAVVARTAAEIQAETGGVRFYARLVADGLDLPVRPGAFVRITLPDRRFADSVELPTEAVHDNAWVYVVGDGDRLEQRKVEVLARAGDGALVSGDMAGGEQVVVTRFNEMGPGVRVRVSE